MEHTENNPIIIAVTLEVALKTYQKDLETERSKILDVDRANLWKTVDCNNRQMEGILQFLQWKDQSD